MAECRLKATSGFPLTARKVDNWRLAAIALGFQDGLRSDQSIDWHGPSCSPSRHHSAGRLETTLTKDTVRGIQVEKYSVDGGGDCLGAGLRGAGGQVTEGLLAPRPRPFSCAVSWHSWAECTQKPRRCFQEVHTDRVFSVGSSPLPFLSHCFLQIKKQVRKQC